MKYSQFNSIVPMSGNYALFNALHQKVIFLEGALYDVLMAAVTEIDTLQHIHPDLYTYLVEQDYVVDDEIDEIDIVKRLSKTVDNNYSSFILTINPNMMCNFGCYYCYETHIAKSRMDNNTIERIRSFITRTVNDNRLEYFPIAFFGGEPLLYFYKDVVPIIEHYVAQCLSKGLSPSVSFTTNGYLVNKDFIDYFKQKGIECSLQITLDGFREKHDRVRFTKTGKGSYQSIIGNIHLLLLNHFFVRLRINYTDQNLDDIHRVAEDLTELPEELRRRFLLLDFHRVWQNDRRDDIGKVLDEQMGRISRLGFTISSKYSPDNVINSCYADKLNSVVINYNGDIYKCTARDFTGSNRAGFIDDDGKLVWDDGYLDRRMEAKFHNAPCLKCRILPVCNGGCSQHALEHLKNGTEYCVYFGDETEKDKVVLSKIQDILRNDGQSSQI
jgi:uncharacterized protein